MDDWESSNFLPDKVLDQNPFSIKKSDDEPKKSKGTDYSGVSVRLADLYLQMLSNGNLDKLNEYFIDFRTEGVVDKIENDINAKFKSVQNATAHKVLSRYYRKFEVRDCSTGMEEDPSALEN